MPNRSPALPDPDPDPMGGTYADVMGLYDSDGGVPTYVLADLTVDDRWLSVPTAATVSLEAWR